MVNDGSKNLCNLEFVSWPKKVSTTVTKHTCQCLTIVLCVYSGNQLKLYFPGWVGGLWSGWVGGSPGNKAKLSFSYSYIEAGLSMAIFVTYF